MLGGLPLYHAVCAGFRQVRSYLFVASFVPLWLRLAFALQSSRVKTVIRETRYETRRPQDYSVSARGRFMGGRDPRHSRLLCSNAETGSRTAGTKHRLQDDR